MKSLVCQPSPKMVIGLFSASDLAAEMIAAAGRSRKLLHYGPPRTGDIYRSCLSNQKAKTLLHWTPSRNIKDGLTETIHFFQDRL